MRGTEEKMTTSLFLLNFTFYFCRLLVTAIYYGIEHISVRPLTAYTSMRATLARCYK